MGFKASEDETPPPPVNKDTEGPVEQKPERPDWLDQQHDSVEAQARAYNDLRKQFSKKTDDLKEDLFQDMLANYGAEVGVPEGPDGYEYPEGLSAPNEEIDKQLRDWAHGWNVPAEGFQDLMNLYNQMQPNPEAELKKLGDDGQGRVDRVNNWATANIGEDHYPVLDAIMRTAIGIEFMEDLMDRSRSYNFAPAEASPSAPPLTREGIRALQADERYEHDANYQAMVRQKWQAWSRQPAHLRK